MLTDLSSVEGGFPLVEPAPQLIRCQKSLAAFDPPVQQDQQALTAPQTCTKLLSILGPRAIHLRMNQLNVVGEVVFSELELVLWVEHALADRRYVAQWVLHGRRCGVSTSI